MNKAIVWRVCKIFFDRFCSFLGTKKLLLLLLITKEKNNNIFTPTFRMRILFCFGMGTFGKGYFLFERHSLLSISITYYKTGLGILYAKKDYLQTWTSHIKATFLDL